MRRVLVIVAGAVVFCTACKGGASSDTNVALPTIAPYLLHLREANISIDDLRTALAATVVAPTTPDVLHMRGMDISPADLRTRFRATQAFADNYRPVACFAMEGLSADEVATGLHELSAEPIDLFLLFGGGTLVPGQEGDHDDEIRAARILQDECARISS